MNIKEDDILLDTKKFEILASAILTSLEAYKSYYDFIINEFFDENMIAKTGTIPDKDGNDIEVPLICCMNHHKLVQISDINIRDTMSIEEAKKILMDNFHNVSNDKILSEFDGTGANKNIANLNGKYTKKELEAIICWMKNPKAISELEVN